MPNINPSTGLSTDYLNHFTEAVMALEMAADIPECLDDLRAWQPKTYLEHFAASRFSNRDAVIRAYHGCNRTAREALNAAAEALSAAIVQARDALPWPTIAADVAALAHTSDALKPRIALVAALINGAAPAADPGSAQAEIDAMFGP